VESGAKPVPEASAIIPVAILDQNPNFLGSFAGACKLRPDRNMGKRTIFDADTRGAHAGHDIKRQRIEGSHERDSPRPNGLAEEVTTARDLQKVLLFDQRAHADFRNGTATLNVSKL